MNAVYRWFLKKKYMFSEKEISMFGLEKAEDYKKYISSKTFRTFRPRMDNRKWGGILLNKLVCKLYFHYSNLPQANFYGYLDKSDGYCFEGYPLQTKDDLFDFLKRHNLRQFVIKHVAGGRGINVYIVIDLSFDKKQLTLIDGQNLSFNSFYGLLETIKPSHNLKGYLLEELVQLHPKISNITMGSPSSLRVITLKDQTGNVNVNLSFIRYGLEGAMTDHYYKGSVLGRIDITTGRVTNALLFKDGKPDNVFAHPNSGKNLEIQIPFWDEVKYLACNAAKLIPGVNFCGWDVLVSESGPVLIEGNAGPDMTSPQILEGSLFENGVFNQWSSVLGIDKPDWSMKWHFNNSKIGQRFKRLTHQNNGI